MELLGHGIDLVSTQRLGEVRVRQGENFETRVFSKRERAYCAKKVNPDQHFAARFAAKEAFSKAMGMNLGTVGNLVEVEVNHDSNGAPTLEISGQAKELFSAKGGKEIALSLSHDSGFAIASVILLGGKV